MYERSFGDVVLYKSQTLEGKVIGQFSSPFNHSAMQVSPNRAQATTWNGEELYYLDAPKREHTGYVILRHNDITDLKRDRLEMFDRITSRNYNTKTIFEMALVNVLKLDKTAPIRTNWKKGGFTCSNRIAYLYRLINLDLGDVHWSQYQPSDFLNDNFRVVKVWSK